MLTYTVQVRKLEIRVVNWSAQGCCYYVIEQRIRPGVLGPQALVLSSKHTCPIPRGHFKNRRETELMYNKSSWVAAYPSHWPCTSRKSPGSDRSLHKFPACLQPPEATWHKLGDQVQLLKGMKIIQIVTFVYTLSGSDRSHQPTGVPHPCERTENMWD